MKHNIIKSYKELNWYKSPCLFVTLIIKLPWYGILNFLIIKGDKILCQGNKKKIKKI